MNRPCDYCIEEECGGGKKMHQCDCDKCANVDKCNKVLWPTIRITTKCTQSCGHCLYECSPESSKMMTISMARKIAKFLKVNHINIITIMGGEFFCNPDWKEIIPILCENVRYCRLVTNGDWAAKDADAVLDVLKPLDDILKISISKDHWHTNKHVKKAIKACKDADLRYNVTSEEEDNDENIIPVGRGQFHYGMYAMFGTYCHQSEHKYHFLIDEEGDIFKCGAGIWNYTDVDSNMKGDFAAIFKKFNQAFYEQFISNCMRCAMAYHNDKRWGKNKA